MFKLFTSRDVILLLLELITEVDNLLFSVSESLNEIKCDWKQIYLN